MAFEYEQEFLGAMACLDADTAKATMLAGGFGPFDYPESGNLSFLGNTLHYWNDELKKDFIGPLSLDEASSEEEIKDSIYSALDSVSAGLAHFVSTVFSGTASIRDICTDEMPMILAQGWYSVDVLEAFGALVPDMWDVPTKYGSAIAYTGCQFGPHSEVPDEWEHWRKEAVDGAIHAYMHDCTKRKFLWFLARGQLPNYADDDGFTAAMHAIHFSSFDWVLEIGEENNIDLSGSGLVNGETLHGYTPLMIACQVPYTYKLQFIQEFLRQGADPNVTARDGTSAILIAQANGEKALVNLLKNAGAKASGLFAKLPDSFKEYCKELSIG